MNMWTKEEIEEFKARLRTQKQMKVDYVVPCSAIQTQWDLGSKTLRLRLGGNDNSRWFSMNKWMQNQVADKCHIYKPYWDYLMESGHQELLSTSVNELIQDKDKRMVRTMGDEARALVSDQYRAIDNYDMFEFFMDAIENLNTTANMDIIIDKCEVTDTRIYMRAISNRLTDEIFGEVDRDIAGKPIMNGLHRGDVVFGGIQVSNSEVGSGSYRVEPLIFVVACQNGLISDKALRRRHIGRVLDEQMIDWSTKTKTLEDELLWNQLVDMVYSTFNPDIFSSWVDSINKVASEVINEPTIVINNVVKGYAQFNKDSKDALLKRIARYGLTKWGLVQSVTDYAQTKPFDTRVELERIGNEILLEKTIEVLEREE